MSQIFEVILPSIPNKYIKYKIQDIKQISFGSQQNRFHQNKKYLTKKFINSFHNFQANTELQSSITTNQSNTYENEFKDQEKKNQEFRNIVPQNKKFLIPLYTDMLEKQQKLCANPQNYENNNNAGFTFRKQGNKSNSYNQNTINHSLLLKYEHLIDNYYFSKNNPNDKTIPQHKKTKPSAVFKNQPRNKTNNPPNKSPKTSVPGPGTYFQNNTNTQKKYSTKSQYKAQQQQQPTQPDYQQLKKIIAQVLKKKQSQHQQPLSSPIKKQHKSDHMFIKNDRDRFGHHVFPIILKSHTPGPGSYEVNDNLQDKIKKVVFYQQQKKLLKEWFNA